MSISRFPIWPIVLMAVLAGGGAAYVWVGAISTASLRFGECGPADASSPDPYCRVAANLLDKSLLLFAAAVFFAIAAGALNIYKHRTRPGGA